MVRAAQVLHVAENPNDSFLLGAELADEGLQCEVLTLSPEERLHRTIRRSHVDLLVVDVPLSSPTLQGQLDEVRRRQPALPVIFRWGGTGQWSAESSGEQLARRVRGALALPDVPARSEADRTAFLDRLVSYQQAYLELLRADSWDFEATVRRILERAADLLEVDRASVWEFTPDHRTLVCVALFVRATRTHGLLQPIANCPRYLAALEQSLTLATDDARADPRTSELVDAYLGPFGIVSMLDAPIRRDGRLVGVVCHEQTGVPRGWALLDQCAAGWVASLVARAMDLRERRQLADRIERAERLEAIGRLAGGLAHDFNNCLTAITGQVELGLEAGDTDSMRQALVEVRAATGNATVLARELLAAGRGQALTLGPLELGALLGRLTPRLRALAGGPACCDITVAPGPAWVRGDANAIERVLVNLVSNATDAVAANGGRVQVVLARGEKPAAGVAIDVIDDGVGMDAATQARLFEPFFTTKAAGAPGGMSPGRSQPGRVPRMTGGTGLGLAGAFGVVRQHGGTISVQSVPGQGSRFTVVLPIIDPP
jgi:signal transduction histidine kinase